MSFYASLGLKWDEFKSGLEGARKDLSKFAGDVQKKGGLGAMGGLAGGAAIAGLAAGAAAATASIVGMYNAMEAGGAMVDLSEQTGVAIDKLMVLQTAFKQAGMSAEDVQPVINKMQKAIAGAATAGGPAAEAFARLGLSASELSGMGADEQLKLVGEAVSKIENPTQKAAAAMEIFGKSGGRALALFAAGGLDDAAEAVGNQARLMRDNAGIFDRVTDVLGTAATKLQGLFVGMASQVAPQLLSAVDAFNKIDLSGIGQQIGNVVAIILEAMSQGVLGALVLDSLTWAFSEAANSLAADLSSIFAGIIQSAIESFALLTDSGFWGGMLTAMVGVAQSFIGIIAKGVSEIIAQWQQLPGIGKAAGTISQSIAKYSEEVSARGAENMGAGGGALNKLIQTSGETVQGAMDRAREFAPRQETPSMAKDLIEKLRVDVGEKSATAIEKFKAEKPALGGEGIGLKAGGVTSISDQLSSLQKAGGGAGGIVQTNIADQQLRVQETMSMHLQTIANAVKGNQGGGGSYGGMVLTA